MAAEKLVLEAATPTELKAAEEQLALAQASYARACSATGFKGWCVITRVLHYLDISTICYMPAGHLFFRGPWRDAVCDSLSTPAHIMKFKEAPAPGMPPLTLSCEHLLSVHAREIALQRGPTTRLPQDCNRPFRQPLVRASLGA